MVQYHSSMHRDWCPYFHFHFWSSLHSTRLAECTSRILVGCPCTVTWHMSARNASGEEVRWRVVRDVICVLTRDRVSILDDLLSSPAQWYAEGSQTHQERVMWHKLSVSWFQTLCSGRKVIRDIVFNLSPDVMSKSHIWVMTPPKFANDCLSGIEDSTKRSIIGAAITIYRKVQRFLRPTHLNQLPGFSAQRSEKRAKQICKFVEVMYRAVMNLLFEGWNLNSFTQSEWRQLKQYHAGGLDKRVRETCLEISKAPNQP